MIRSAVGGAILALALASALTGQVSTDPRPSPWKASVVAGPSWFLVDFWESDSNTAGAAVRVGADLPGFGLGLALSRWPDVRGFRLTNAQLEIDFSLAEGRLISPHLVAAAGYTKGKYLGTGPSSPPDGASAGYGIGFKLRPVPRFGIRTDATIRTDDGGWNAEVRVLGGWIPKLDPGTTDMQIEAEVFWMLPVAGPWELVEPGYSVGVVRPWTDQVGAVLSMSVIHWQIPTGVHPRGYLWDTRMFMAVPALQWESDHWPVLARFGPVIASMGEGPDMGANIGAQARGLWVVEVSDFAFQFSLGGLWLSLDASHDPRAGDSDQLGLTLGAGVRY